MLLALFPGDQILVPLFLILIVLDFLTHLIAAWIGLAYFEKLPPMKVEELPPNPGAIPFSFEAEEGTRLRGCYWPSSIPPRGLVLFCPEFGSNCYSALQYVERLHQIGFVIVSIDFRGQGTSLVPGASSARTGRAYVPLHWATQFELLDLRGALRFVDSRPEWSSLPMILFGVSRGGCLAISEGLGQPARVRGVVADSPYDLDWHTSYYFRRWAKLYVPQWLLNAIPNWHINRTVQLMICLSEWRRRCSYHRLMRQTSARKRLAPIQGTSDSERVLLIAGSLDNYSPAEFLDELCSQIGTQALMWIVPDAKHNQARNVAPKEYDQQLEDFCLQVIEQPSRPS